MLTAARPVRCFGVRGPHAQTGRTSRLIVRADSASAPSLAAGDKVKVKSELKVFHVPGFKAGLDMQGQEGTVEANVTMFKDNKLSPNMPWKVAFETELKGKKKKFFVHMEEEELEKV